MSNKFASRSPGIVSYSANREDVFINRLFAAQPTGFYVDVGAAHPMYENDTKALYDRGWRGVNIEPNRDFFSELAAERPRDRNLNLAVSDTAGSIIFHEVVGTGLSTCDVEEAQRAAAKGFQVVMHEVETDTLRHILEQIAPPSIDLFKIDVEGFELKVLESNDWGRFRPTLILAESTYPETPTRRPDAVSPFLASHGYRRVYFDGLNDYFVAEEFNLPDDVFDRPPNVFDNFVPFLQHNLERERDAAVANIVSLEGVITRQREASAANVASLEAEITRSRAELLAMRQRGVDLADQLEQMSIQHDLTVAQFEQMSIDNRQRSVSVPAEASARARKRSGLSRLVRAAKRPRHTLREMFGQGPD